jgi:hypothetical protein
VLPIEEVDMGGGASYLKGSAVPHELGEAPQARPVRQPVRHHPKLDALRELEELDLGCSLGRLKRLPDLSKLPKLRVLNLSGFINIDEPGHDLLAQLFAMRLPALTDLRIDRWGKSDDTKRKHLTPETLAGIGKLSTLQKIDLEFNGLKKLPDDFYKLTALTELKLDYNRFGKAEIAKIRKTWPNAAIDIGTQE